MQPRTGCWTRLKMAAICQRKPDDVMGLLQLGWEKRIPR